MKITLILAALFTLSSPSVFANDSGAVDHNTTRNNRERGASLGADFNTGRSSKSKHGLVGNSPAAQAKPTPKLHVLPAPNNVPSR